MKNGEYQHIDLDLISELVYNDKKYIIEFAEAMEQSFTEFRDSYGKFLRNRDEKNFRQAGHKIKPVAQMLHIDEIVDEYEHAKTLIWDEKPDEELEQSAEKVEALCREIIEELEHLQQDFES